MNGDVVFERQTTHRGAKYDRCRIVWIDNPMSEKRASLIDMRGGLIRENHNNHFTSPPQKLTQYLS